MTHDQLRERLAGLPLGDMVLLSKAEFEQAFAHVEDHDDNRRAAIELAEVNGCRLIFRDGLSPYAVFTPRQRVTDFVSSSRARVVS